MMLNCHVEAKAVELAWMCACHQRGGREAGTGARRACGGQGTEDNDGAVGGDPARGALGEGRSGIVAKEVEAAALFSRRRRLLAWAGGEVKIGQTPACASSMTASPPSSEEGLIEGHALQ
jgi:hypothetical protein